MTTTHPVPTTRFNGRALHLIDLENLAGGPAVDVDEIARTWAAYRGGVPQTESDHVMVGSCSLFARKAWWVLPATGVQRRVRDGADGGELSLLDDLDLEQTARRFQRLVIASGDGMFTETALRARALGMHVHHVTGHGRPARRLLAAVTTRSRLRLSTPAVSPVAA